ncbi:MAG: serine hydrolase [Clostridia bacterium]|nr:serine hydrolase [Clostridia bacterium]
MDKYIAPSVSVAAVNRFYKKMAEKHCEIRTLQIYKDGELMVRIAQPPYSCTDNPEVYSLSKMFTSTVVGIASDMGYLSSDDYVLKYFPEIKTDCEYFHKMKIKHVLSMNTGHENCVMSKMSFSDDAVAGFFSVEPKFEPGTHFTYNTGATCLLGIIVSRATGMDFFDFAVANLFYPLGIHNIRWSRIKDGSCLCGAGLHISSDDICKLCLTYLNKGVYNGRRILSEEWINEASQPISDSTGNGTEDWSSGYGYQLWMNSRDGYRGDGAFGQLGMVLPQHNAIIAVQAVVGDMQTEVDGVMELLESFDMPEVEEADDYSFPPMAKVEGLPNVDMIYKLEENPQGFGVVHLTVNEDGVKLAFSDFDYNVATVNCGNGQWLKSSFIAKNMTSFITELMPTDIPEPLRAAGCVKSNDDKLVLCLRYLSNPHIEDYNISYNDDEIEIYVSLGMRNDETRTLKGQRIK